MINNRVIKQNFFIHSQKDNIAVASDDLNVGTVVKAKAGGKELEIKLLNNISLGHKFALQSIPKGGGVIKYGETIGVAVKQIRSGSHVHVHNIKSLIYK